MKITPQFAVMFAALALCWLCEFGCATPAPVSIQPPALPLLPVSRGLSVPAAAPLIETITVTWSNICQITNAYTFLRWSPALGSNSQWTTGWYGPMVTNGIASMSFTNPAIFIRAINIVGTNFYSSLP